MPKPYPKEFRDDVVRVGMSVLRVGEGEVEFGCVPDATHLNPLGTVHGGFMCTVLDSALGCAAHTTLPAGVGYTSVDITVSYLRSASPEGGPLRAIGTVVKPGRRVIFAEARLLDGQDRLVAMATGSLLVLAPSADAW